ncbi:MAG: YPDG domain-containing protein [Lactobacillus crispatus]|nr:YPDG domain-containing protein [Lactobacillus crispatus]
MLSKNNYKERLRKMEPKKERFSIRKFTVGAASVLIGFTIFGMNNGQSVKADEVQPSKAVEVNKPETDSTASDHTSEVKGNPNSKSGTDQQGEKGKATGSESSTNTNPVAQKSKDATNTENQTQGVDSAKRVANKNLTPSQNNGKGGVYGSESAIETNKMTLEQTTVESKGDEVTKEVGANLTTNSSASKKAAQAMVSFAAQPAAQPQETTQQNLRGTQSQSVTDWQGFVNAMNDSSIGTITLDGDITVANKGTSVNGITRPNPVVNSGKMNLTGENISGGLVINGQGHAINFGANYLSFTTNNQKDSNPWDITFKNLTINADGYDNSWSNYGGAFSPIYMGGDDINTNLLAKNKVTFENVTADVKNGAFYNTTMAQQVIDNPYTTVTFKGNNNITVEAVNVAGNQLDNYSSAVSASHIIFADGSNTVFNVSSAKTNNSQNAGGNILRAKDDTDTDPAINVQQGATVTLNGKSTDVKGMLVNNAITGTVQVDGNLNANMADGHSMAIWAGNLNIGKAGVVNINTKQSNNGSGLNGVTDYNGYHFAPISLGVGFAANLQNADANTLDNQGKLTIVRSGDNASTSPLISFGSGAAAAVKGTFTLNVTDGATLDLQDSAQSSMAGATTNTPKYGLITMWGPGSSSTANNINITNPAYVNLQRTGKQTGTLIRLENLTNNVTVQSNGGDNPLPLAQWDEGNYNNPSSYWYINNLTSQNNWGDNSISGFAGQGQTAGANKAGEAKFLHSNGIVTMGGSQAGLNQYQYTDGTITQGQPNPGVDYETPYLNKFLNNFNWWTPQRVAMGTNLADVAKPTDAQKYQPQTQVITGYTDQTLNDLTAANGISGYVDENGQPVNLTDTTVAWYNPATDADAWKDAMGDQPAPTNPTGNLKVTDGSAWAKVTYQDGTVDFANIPLDIKSQAEEYNPLGQNVNTSVGSEPSAKDGISNTSDLPTSAQYSWSTTPDVSKAGIVPSIVNVTYDDGSMDEVPVNVIVKDSKGNIPDKAGDAAENDPQGKDVSTVIGKLPDPSSAVDWPKNPVNTDNNPIDPTQIKYGWSTTPDIWTQGNHPGVVKVTYPDNTTDLVPTTVIVTNSPTGQSTSIKQGGDIPDPSTVIDWTNNGKVPDGTKPTDPKVTYTWVDKPTTTNPGQQTGTVKITYPNGESTVVRVPVTVTPTGSTYNPYAQHLVLPYSPTGDGVPEAGSVIELPNGETAPAGVQYTWETKPDTTKPGMQTDNITATWTAGGKPNTKYIPVTVTVGPMADYYNPKANDLTVPYNADMNKYPAKNQITDLPADLKTDDVWAPMPVTSVPGTQPTMIKVTYSDGSFDYVPLNVTVGDNTKDSDTYQPSYDPMNVKQGESKSEDPSYPESTPQGSTTTINPGSKAPEGTKYEIVGDNTPFATVDPNTGKLTIAPTADNSKTGLTTVPVTVTYPDQSSDAVNVPVYIGDATHTGKIIPDPTDPTKTSALEVVTDPNAFDKAHETTDNSMNLTAGQAVSAINQYTVGEDGKVTSTSVDKTNATITWKDPAPTTVVTTPSASEDLTGTVSVKVGDTTVDSNPMTIKAAGATAKDVTNPVKVTVGQDLTDAQKNDLVDTSNLDNAGIQYTASWASAPKASDTQATIRLTFTDKDAQGNPTYLDVQTKDGAINVVPAGEYSPSYKTVTVEKGSTASDPVVTTNGVPKPDGTKFVAGDNVPTWATVDPTTGTITLKPGQDATPGFYKIPVTVSVPGKDTQTVTAPVMITGNDPEHHTYYGNQSMTSFITPTISVHRTTDSHELDPNIAKIQQIVYRTDWDGKGSAASDYKTVTTYNLQGDKYVNAQDPSDSFDANVIKYSWVKAGNGILTPNSNWDIANGTGDILYDPANPNSKEQTSSGESLPGNSKWRVNYSFDDSDLFGYIGLSTQDSWMNTYFNFYGSTTNQPLTFKQNQNISNLSQDQFKTLINVNSLENGWGGTNSSDSAQANDSAKTFTMTWAENGQPSTKNIANGVKGTVRINFSDGTYLDVPATINVEAATPTPENFTQSIVYKDAKGNVIFTAKDAIKGQFTSTTPAIVSAEAQKNAIDSNVPEKWVISKSYTYPSAETVNTTAPSAIEVLVEHGTKDITPTTPGVNPTDPKYKDMFKTVTRDIYQTKPGEAEKKIDTQSVEFGRNGIEDLVTGEVTGTGNWQAGTIQNHKFVLGGQPEFVSMNAPQISDYDSYVNGTKTTTVSSASALNNGQPVNGAAVHITYLKSDNITPVPYNPSDKDMNKDVTRTITIYKTDGTTDIITQNVHFVRGGEGQNAGTKDQDGNITWTEWTVATKDNNSWKSTGASEGSWQEYDVTPVDGYKSTVNGHEATKVDAKTVNADTPNANVTVAYTKTTEPTDPTINPNKPGENSDMYAHPTRTINVKNPVTGKTDTSTQVVWFGRTKTVSTDPNVKTVYGDWQLGKVENDKFIIDKDATSTWPAFTAPAFTGFTPSQDSVAEVTPTADTKDAVVTITYTKNGGGEITPPTPQQGQVIIIYRDESGNEVGRTTIPGTEGTTIDPSSAIKNGVPAGYKIKDGYNAPTSASVSSSITVPVVKTDNGGNTTPSDNKPTDKTPGKDDNSGKKVDHHKAKNNGQNIRTETKHNSGNNQAAGLHSKNHSYNSNVHGKRANSNNTAVQAEKNAKTLPQTGEKQDRASIIGLALASIAGLLGFGVDRKRKHN